MIANRAGRRRRAPAAAGAALFLICACGGGEADRPRSGQDGAGTLSPASLAFSAQAPARLERRVWAETLEVPARIAADERRSVQVAAPAAGRIESVAIKDFDQPVKAGEVLATLYAPELVAAQREFLLLDPRKEPALARKAEERLLRMGLPAGLIRSLRERGEPAEKAPIASPRDGFVIPATIIPETGPAGAAAAGPEGAPGGGMADGMGGMAGGAAAPMAGAAPAASAPLRAGAYVERGSLIATINDLAVVAAEMALPAAQAALFRAGDSVHIELRDAGFAGMARLDFLAAQVADSSGNVLATAYLGNRDGRLKPGLLGKAHLAPAPETAWVLPRAAVHDLGERHIAWMRSAADSGAFEAREVRIGRAGTKYVEILEGLPPGAAVAAQASLLIDPDVMVEPLPSPAGEIPSASSHAGHGEAQDQGEGHAGHGEALDQGPGHAGHDLPQAAETHTGHGAGAPGTAGSSASGHAGHGGPPAAAGTEPAPLLRLSPEKARLAGIRTAAAALSPLAAARTFRAVIQWDARSRESVPARAEGRILQVAVLRPGEKVARGQILAVLESETALAAQEEFLSVLRQAPGLPPDLARTQIRAARRRLETVGLPPGRIDALAVRGRPYPSLSITCPRDGLLLEAFARPGQYVQAGAPLFSIGLADRIWAETWLLPDETGAYPMGTEAWVKVEGRAGDPVPGRLEHVRQTASAPGAVTLAHVGLENPPGDILPGTQARVTFRQPARAVLNLPASALLRSSGMTEVWVETEAWAYAPRAVRTGVEADDRVEILAGVAAGEKVVVAGGYLLRSEWTLRHGAGMAHGGH